MTRIQAMRDLDGINGNAQESISSFMRKVDEEAGQGPEVIDWSGPEIIMEPSTIVVTSDILESLLKGAKKDTVARTRRVYEMVLYQKPTTFSGFKTIANVEYTKNEGKPVEGSFLRQVIIKKFVGGGLIEWSGIAKDPIRWL